MASSTANINQHIAYVEYIQLLVARICTTMHVTDLNQDSSCNPNSIWVSVKAYDKYVTHVDIKDSTI